MITSNFYGIPYYLDTKEQSSIIDNIDVQQSSDTCGVWLYFFGGVVPSTEEFSKIDTLGRLIGYHSPLLIFPDLQMTTQYFPDIKQRTLHIDMNAESSFRKDGTITWVAMVGELDEDDSTRYMWFSSDVNTDYKSPVVIDKIEGNIGDEVNLLKTLFIIRDAPQIRGI
jgi:hypothetical protein